MASGERITDVAAVPEESTLLVTVEERESGEQREAMLIRADAEVNGWFNYCQHWRDVSLDTGDGAMVRDGEIVCSRHGATFESDDGECTFGPCEGAVLDELPSARLLAACSSTPTTTRSFTSARARANRTTISTSRRSLESASKGRVHPSSTLSPGNE